MRSDITARTGAASVRDPDSFDRVPACDPDSGHRSPELKILCRPPYPNALFIGPSRVAGAALATLFPLLRHPITLWDPCREFELSAIAWGTLVIWNTDLLDVRQQTSLLGLTDREPAIQIISIAGSELLDRVDRREFLEVLYYRLNVIRPYLTASGPSSITSR